MSLSKAEKKERDDKLVVLILRIFDEVSSLEIVPGKQDEINGISFNHDEILENWNPVVRLLLTKNYDINCAFTGTTLSKIYKKSFVPTSRSSKIKKNPKIHCSKLSYIKPPFFDRMLLNFKCATEYEKTPSSNVLFYGMHGTGKTSCVNEIVEQAGFSRVFHQNGTDDMSTASFLGSHTLLVDETSLQSYVAFCKGPLYQAFIEGTEVDDDGNQILYNDKGEVTIKPNGKPKIIGPPALYFLDEFAVIDPRIFLSVFNRAMEIPDNPNQSRTIEIAEDGGRVVKSHPGFALILSGNLLGKGIENISQSGYTAQNNQHDDSTLNRINAVFEFGYNLVAEKKIMSTLTQDDDLTTKLIEFTKKIRKEWSLATVDTLFSTRNIVSLCKQYKIYSDAMQNNPMGLAFKDTIFTGLRDKETLAWNNSINLIFNVDVLNAFKKDEKNMLIPRRNSSLTNGF